MIVKVLSRHNPNYKSLINYILKGAENVGEKPQIFTHNLRSQNSRDWEMEYLENEALRQYPRSNNVYFFHEIISFSDKEKQGAITKEMLDDIGRQYIKLRGTEAIYMGAVHTEKSHTHIHFCTSGVKFRTGKAFRVARSDLQKVKCKLQEYHRLKYPLVTKSFPQHGKGRMYATDREWQVQHRDGRTSTKEQVRYLVQECFSHAKTQKDFLESLREKNLHFYERNGVPTGLIYEDMKIRFSRLGISKEQFLSKRPDRTEEEKALSAIQQLRNRQRDNNKEFELNK